MFKTEGYYRLDAFLRFCEKIIEKYWKNKKLEPSTLKKKKIEKVEKKTGKTVGFVYPKIVDYHVV